MIVATAEVVAVPSSTVTVMTYSPGAVSSLPSIVQVHAGAPVGTAQSPATRLKPAGTPGWAGPPSNVKLVDTVSAASSTSSATMSRCAGSEYWCDWAAGVTVSVGASLMPVTVIVTVAVDVAPCGSDAV